MNPVAKGRRNEKRCSDFWKDRGWHVWKTFRAKFQNLDMFKLFDVVALHPQGQKMVFIQVKSNRCDKKTRDAIRALKMPKGCEKWIWIWHDHKGWTMENFNGSKINKK